MVFSTSSFLFLFFPAVLLGYYLLSLISKRLLNLFLFLASISFYCWNGTQYVWILLVSIAVNYTAARLIEKSTERHTRRFLLAVAVAINLGLLGYYKYAGFIFGEVHRLTGLSAAVKEIVLPVGISFYTFQALSYVIDVYRGEDVIKNPIDLGMYITFFPQLIAGPIVRYGQIRPDLHGRKASWADAADGMERLCIGLCKKVFLANNLGVVADAAFNMNPSKSSVAMLWLAAVAYALQIYYDFSGYSDMAIGIGRLFGFHFPENFNHPYAASSITDFWRRWHMTLSGWFRDYVYIPLGGSRQGTGRTVFNLLVVWALTGLWHGAAWQFVLWGLAYFVLLVVEKYVIQPERFTSWWAKALYRIPVLLFVLLLWVLFRVERITAATAFLSAMFGLKGLPPVMTDAVFYVKEYAVYLAAGIIFAVPFYNRFKERFPGLFAAGRSLVVLGGTLSSISYILTETYNPFLYFQF